MCYCVHWEIKGGFKGVGPVPCVSSRNQMQVFEVDCE